MKLQVIRRLTYRQLRDGTLTPWGFGFAWHEPEFRENVYILLPFNWLAAWIRSLVFVLMEGPRDRFTRDLEQKLESEYSTGFGLGYKDGEGRAWEAFARRIKILEETGHMPVGTDAE